MKQNQVNIKCSGIPLEQAEQQRLERIQRDKEEADRIREMGYELAKQPCNGHEHLVGLLVHLECDEQLNESEGG